MGSRRVVVVLLAVAPQVAAQSSTPDAVTEGSTSSATVPAKKSASSSKAPSPASKSQAPSLGSKSSATLQSARDPEAAPSTPPAPDQKYDPTTLGFQLGTGVVARLGGGLDPEFAEHERVDLAYGVGAWFAPSRLFSLGLRYERVGEGGERTKTGAATLRVQRDLDALMLGARVYPIRGDAWGMYMHLGLGLSNQHLDANGARPATTFGPGPTFACSASDGPGLSLSSGAGLDIDVARRFAFLAEGHISAYRHGGEVLDACAPGSGSITNIGANLGFMYRFELAGLGG